MASPAPAKTRPAPPPAPAKIAGTLLLSWLIPGGGFLGHGQPKRGWVLFVALNLTFALGLALNGGVVWPSWDWRDPNSGFNIVNNLTFLLQMGCGLPSLVSVLVHSHGAAGWLAFLSAEPMDPYYDLSSFYLLVAGAMNYFVVCNTYDRLFGARNAPQAEAPAKTQTEEP